jgi:hypothetical protein
MRNSKQFQMTRKKHQNVPNNPDSASSFWNFLEFLIYLATICFGSFDMAQDRFRASNFEFTLLGFVSDFDIRISDFVSLALAVRNARKELQ